MAPPVPVPKAVPVETFTAYLNRASLTGSSLTPELAAQHICAAESLIEGRISYEIAPITETRTIWTGGDSVCRLPGGLRVVNEITWGTGNVLDVEAYRLLKVRDRPFHLITGLPWGVNEITIDGEWGFVECPVGLVNAVCAVAARDHFQRLNRQADVSQSADGSASSYFDRLPTVATQAITEYTVPGV
jgi:hypothetical protein